MDPRAEPQPSELIPELRRSLPIALLRAREVIISRFRPILNRHGLSEQQWRVLRVLSEMNEPIDASNLASRSFILPPSLTRILKSLAERDLISCERDRIDGRRTLLVISQPGREIIRTVGPESRQVFLELENRYGTERVEALLDMLEDLTQKLAK